MKERMAYLGILVERAIGACLELHLIELIGVEDAVCIVKVACGAHRCQCSKCGQDLLEHFCK